MVIIIKFWTNSSQKFFFKVTEFLSPTTNTGPQALKNKGSLKPSNRGGLHISSGLLIILIIVFIAVVCALSIVALLYGFKRGKESKSEFEFPYCLTLNENKYSIEILFIA